MLSKRHFNLIGGGFQHAPSSTLWKVPTKLVWDYQSNKNPISVCVDGGILQEFHSNTSTLKLGWILESKFISGQVSSHIISHLDDYKSKFKFILTHKKDLLQLDPVFFKWCPAYGTYIDDIQDYTKSKMVSMIASRKQFTTAHTMRCKVYDALEGIVDRFGRDTNPIDKKEQGLCSYLFSIAIENDSYETYFTEKLLDCFATGTIPIYWGAPIESLKPHFNVKGIVPLPGEFDVSKFNFDLYMSLADYRKENLEYVRKYDILDDWIYEEYLSKL